MKSSHFKLYNLKVIIEKYKNFYENVMWYVDLF